MGHIRLGVIPKSPKWKTVIGLLEDTDVPASQVAGKVIETSERILESQSAQSSVGYCVWILAQLTSAARQADFTEQIAGLGINVGDSTTATEFLAKVAQVASRQLQQVKPRTAINNIADLALRETLSRSIGQQAATLFGASLSDTQEALKRYSTQKQFSSLLHDFFSAFLSRTLRFVIDKEVANHVGPGRRFHDLEALHDFDDALDGFAGQTSGIVDVFSGGWYSKKVWLEGEVTEKDASGFVHVALKKLIADLKLNEAPQ